jgi:hypothetical protein
MNGIEDTPSSRHVGAPWPRDSEAARVLVASAHWETSSADALGQREA